MKDHVCQSCLDRSKEEDWYPFQGPIVVDPIECAFHPRYDNWRVYRTLATIQHFSNQPEGWKDNRCPTPITLPGGFVHLRNLKCIIFDYEVPYIELHLEEGLLEDQDVERWVDHVDPAAVRLTALGDAVLREYNQSGKNQEGANAACDWLQEEKIKA